MDHMIIVIHFPAVLKTAAGSNVAPLAWLSIKAGWRSMKLAWLPPKTLLEIITASMSEV